MPEEVHYLPGECLIKVHSFGTTSLTEWRTSLNSVVEIANSEGARLVLVDTREQTKSPGIEDIYQFSISIPNNLKVAIILPNILQCKNVEEMEDIFQVQVAQVSFSRISSDKGKQVKLFDNYPQAVTWLKESA